MKPPDKQMISSIREIRRMLKDFAIEKEYHTLTVYWTVLKIYISVL